MRKLGLTILLAVLVYAAFAVATDARALGDALSSVDPVAVLAALALSTLNYVIRFGRWTRYLARLRVSVPLGESARIFTAGLTMSITPGKLGEAWKSVLLRETRGTPVSRTAGIVVAERLTDLLALLVLLALSAWKALDPRLGLVTLVVAVALWTFFAFPAASRPLILTLERLGRATLARRLESFIGSTAELLGPLLLFEATVIAMAGWALEAYALTVLAAGLGLELASADAIFVYATSTIAGALAMIPGGLGVTEGSMTALLGRALPNSAAPERIALTLLSRFTTLWWGVLLGILAYGRHVRASRAPS
jgi:glycosyltransferase 2 family protein